jgi:hypothetical protein
VKPRKIRLLALAFLLAGCGAGDAPPWAGSWSAPEATMSILGQGPDLAGTGVETGAAGRAFTVTGSMSGRSGAIDFHYPDETLESFVATQPDPDHLALQGVTRSLQFVRQN